MEAKAGRANSLVFGGLPQANGQKAAQVFMEKILELQYTVRTEFIYIFDGGGREPFSYYEKF